MLANYCIKKKAVQKMNSLLANNLFVIVFAKSRLQHPDPQMEEQEYVCLSLYDQYTKI
jgi:hypothetical protein